MACESPGARGSNKLPIYAVFIRRVDIVRLELIFKIHCIVFLLLSYSTIGISMFCGKLPEGSTPFPLQLVSLSLSVLRTVLSDSGDEKRFNEFVKFLVPTESLRQRSGRATSLRVFLSEFHSSSNFVCTFKLEFPHRNLTNFAHF